MNLRFYRLTAILLLSTALTLLNCQRDSDDAAEQERIASFEVSNDTVAALLDSLTEVIHEQYRENRVQLYTEESREAVEYNNTLGIGTAGTLDEIVLDEIDQYRRKIRENAADNTPVRLIQRNGDALLVTWPSGRQGTIIVRQTPQGVFLDIIRSPGGDILLIKE